eukprot:scaffold11664_cov126-Isochrysis_galbana.AAC.4
MRCEMDHSHLFPISRATPRCYTAVGWRRRLEPGACRVSLARLLPPLPLVTGAASASVCGVSGGRLAPVHPP